VFEPLSETHGRNLREECLSEAETVERRVQTGDHEERVVPETVAQGAIPWIGAIAEMLDWYEGYRDRSLRMARGSKVRGDYESFLVDMDNSLTPAYQSKQYARLNAFKRQFIGGEYPNGETVEGKFSDPITVLFGLTASSLQGDGSHRPPVDHDRDIRNAWKGSSGSVKRTLRYVLEDTLGLEPGEYAWWWQSEPHPGPEKAATAYSHSHPVVVFDGAAVPDGAAATEPETYLPVVEKHIEKCEGAEWSAHLPEDSISVREADDIEDFASYVAEYLSVAPDDDLLERSDEYLMWAASQWATTTQKYSRSKWATAAVKADRCEQEAMDPEAEQTAEHGERVVRAARNTSHRFECAECGSPHGIDQSKGSLARHRLDATAGAETAAGATAATDGGVVVGGESGDESGRTLRERWPSARSAGRVGSEARAKECGHTEPDTCPLCATETEAPHHTVSGEVPIPETATAPEAETTAEGFDRPPEWSPEAVVQTASGDETVIGSPGGTSYAEVVVRGEQSAVNRSVLPYLPEPSVLEGPEPWEGTDLFTESDVRLGRVPPPEIVAREVRERYTGPDGVESEPCPECGERMKAHRRSAGGTTECARCACDDDVRDVPEVRVPSEVTPKEWPSDWYERRAERESESAAPDDEPELSERDRERVEELVRVQGVESVPAVLGRLGIDPSHREEVEEIVAEARSE
jgi:hypothetical protein